MVDFSKKECYNGDNEVLRTASGGIGAEMAVFHTDKIDFFEHKVYPVGTKMPVIHFHNHHELYFLERGKVPI